jgi:hypothetical protein
MTETDSGRLKELEERADAQAEAEGNPFDDLIEMILNLDPGKYGQPFSDIELQKMREIITAGRGKFPKKVIPYVELMRKFLFANMQLIALAALAHQTAQKKADEEKSLIKPATFSDLGKLEAEKLRNGG